FGGEEQGLWSESVEPIVGRRPLLVPGREVAPEQFAGRRVPNRTDVAGAGQTLLSDWATWDSYKLAQTSADGFTLQKRANDQSAWIDACAVRRASGLSCVGDVSGGLGVSVKNFWQSHPASLEVHGATGTEAE